MSWGRYFNVNTSVALLLSISEFAQKRWRASLLALLVLPLPCVSIAMQMAGGQKCPSNTTPDNAGNCVPTKTLETVTASAPRYSGGVFWGGGLPGGPVGSGGLVVGGFIASSGAQQDGRDPNQKKDCGGQGNPILPSTGNKIEPELDFASNGEMGLTLGRTYNHYWMGVGLFGKNWVSSFDYKLVFGEQSVASSCYPRAGNLPSCVIGSGTVIYAWRPDGRAIKFLKNAADGSFYEDKPQAVARIVPQADGSFMLYGEDREVETYTSGGYAQRILDEHGIGWTFTYSNSTYLYRVTHTSGRYVQFSWTDRKSVV